MGNLIDLTGQTFDRLTVIKRADDYVRPNGQHGARWLCKCSCGNYVVVLGQLLREKKTRSCGCLHNEELAEARKKYNTYNVSSNYGVGYTFKGEEFYFDLEDYDKIKDYCWTIRNNGYVTAYCPTTKNHILLHRLIMGCDNDNLYIDHIHGNKTRNDNRKSNLRIATPSQNIMNKPLLKNNTSGVTGVSWNKRKGRWESYITIDDKRKGLGYFSNFNDAVAARKAAEEKYFGEYSYDNSVKDGING